MYATKGITRMTLNDRFTLMNNTERPVRGVSRGRSRGRTGVSAQASLRSRQLMEQMENRPSVRAVLRLKRFQTPFKPSIKQRLTLKRGMNNRRGFQRSNSIGSLYTVPLKSESQTNFRNLRRSSSMNSLNSFVSNNGRSRNINNRSRSRTRSRSRSQNRNQSQNRFQIRNRSQSQTRSRTPQRRGRGRATRIFRRNSASGFDTMATRKDTLKQSRGRTFNRSRGGAQRTNTNARGRIIRNRRNSNAQMNSQNQVQSNRRRGMTAGRARRGNRGRGRGGNNNSVPIKKEQLDAELDNYMSGSKSHLDQDLEKYMNNTSMDFD